jgi:hypothetical protein
MRLWRERRAKLGIAVGPGGILATRVGRNGWAARQAEVWSRPLALPVDAAGDWSDLSDALAELRARLEGRPFGAHVVLLAPLVQLRSIDLPPLGEDEARRLLTRDAGRYFFAAREPQVVAVRRTPKRQGRSGVVLGAAAPASLVDAVYREVEAAGGQVLSILPAHIAWTAAAAWLWPDLSRGVSQIVVDSGMSLDVLRVVDGELSFVRRLRQRPSCDPDLLVDAISRSGQGFRTVAVIASEDAGRHVADLLAEEEIVPVTPARDVWLSTEPAAAAAVFAARGGSLNLLPERMYDRARRRARRATVALGAAAGLLLAAAGGIEWWGLQREMHAVRAQRAAIRPHVERVSAVQDVLTQVNTDLAMLVSLESDAPRWSGVLITVADHLPRDAHLSAFRARADTVVLEGMARDASGVFEAMQHASGVSTVRADSPIRRELRDGQPVVERFALRAHVGGKSEPAEALP